MTPPPGQNLLPVSNLLRPGLLPLHPPLLEKHQNTLVARLPCSIQCHNRVIVCPDAKNISQMGPMLMAMKSTKLNIGLEKEAPSKKRRSVISWVPKGFEKRSIIWSTVDLNLHRDVLPFLSISISMILLAPYFLMMKNDEVDEGNDCEELAYVDRVSEFSVQKWKTGGNWHSVPE